MLKLQVIGGDLNLSLFYFVANMNFRINNRKAVYVLLRLYGYH